MHDSMKEFLEVLRSTNKSEGTISRYRQGLTVYSEWLDAQNLEPEAVSKRDIQRYLGYLKGEKGYAHNTVRLRFAAISQFYEDLVDTEAVESDPTEKITLADYAPKTTRKEEETKEKHIWLAKDEVQKLVENVPAPTLRNRLVVLFQYYTGLRRAEVCDVTLADLDRENRQVQIRGKNGTVHTAHWQPKLDGLLTAWLDGGYRAASPYARESDYLFLTESSLSLSPSRLNDVVREAAENAGIQEVLYTDASGSKHYKITSHTLRHSFAMHYLQNGGSIEGLSKLLAHSSVTTTEIYGEILEERAKDEYEQFAPQINF
ncbi:tyrosine-type recombinase/integrase [Halobacterium zhouii]|uniref:tyrosine-type recombinase/integrase n=1 Tax=Halobacterium zhouii TaxID=2902624 RepID=UPI001E3ECE17|nr:tyrosine-type recombinase/integrase [Halobacterium zhouii]